MPYFHLYDPGRWQRLLLHIVFWSGYFAIRLYLAHITFNVYDGFPAKTVFLLVFSNTALIAVSYYTFISYLWPLLTGRKYIRALLVLLVILVVYTLADAGIEKKLVMNCTDCLAILHTTQPNYYTLIRSGLFNIFITRFVTMGAPASLLLMLCIPLCLKFALNAWRQQTKSLQLAKENLELEFNFLKAQLNPHFLFNSLNNIYGLILSGNRDRSAELVARLSGLLRYLLYDSNQQYMPLDREIRLISDYAELEKVRLNDTRVEFTYSTDNKNYSIPPLLFMPLLENAFKFCTDQKGAAIIIQLEIVSGAFNFTVTNTVDPQQKQAETGGIGLSNLVKRLELYYPGAYFYEGKTTGNLYTVVIKIRLS